SAGACVAALMLSERGTEVGDLWMERTKGITSNFDWRLLFSGQRPTPHEPIYRALLLHAFCDGGFDPGFLIPYLTKFDHNCHPPAFCKGAIFKTPEG
ncbi:MAG TPA: hypothetical protein VF498_19030, partial [Anaerolineales bacterium]